MLRVVCCWTKLDSATSHWLTTEGPPWLEFVRTSDGPYAYWQAIADRWARGDDLLIVEHDVSGPPGLLATFAQCPHYWCTSPYDPAPVNAYGGLGCTKFSRHLQDQILASQFRAPWHELADCLAGRAAAMLDVHAHPPVRHHHGEQDRQSWSVTRP